jgi:hypothetical protein
MKQIMSSVIALCLLVSSTVFAAAIQLPRTGQTLCYNNGAAIACSGTGQDGDKQKGVIWPAPRFVDNANGTVTDNLTGLIWLKDAYCFGTKNWRPAMTSANTLASGACGLSDGSTAGMWRLPNRTELMSLVDRSNSRPALPAGHPFTDVQSTPYWSSSTTASMSTNIWYVDLEAGYVQRAISNPLDFDHNASYLTWPVRAAQ